MNIVHCTENHSTLWDDFVMQNEMATFYHRFAWKVINEKCFGHKTFYLAVDRGKSTARDFPNHLSKKPVVWKNTLLHAFHESWGALRL